MSLSDQALDAKATIRDIRANEKLKETNFTKKEVMRYFFDSIPPAHSSVAHESRSPQTTFLFYLYCINKWFHEMALQPNK